MDSGVSSRQENSKVQGVQVVKLQYMTGVILKWRVMNEIRRGKHRSNLIDHTALQDQDLCKLNLDLVISKKWDGKPAFEYIRGKAHMTAKNKEEITRGFYKNTLCFCGIGSKN